MKTLLKWMIWGYGTTIFGNIHIWQGGLELSIRTHHILEICAKYSMPAFVEWHTLNPKKVPLNYSTLQDLDKG